MGPYRGAGRARPRRRAQHHRDLPRGCGDLGVPRPHAVANPLVDRHRNRDLDRTASARRVLFIEVASVVALVVAAAVTASARSGGPPRSCAARGYRAVVRHPFACSRRLVPELAGTYWICSVAAMILLAAGHPSTEAVAARPILAGRATTAIPHVRAQIARLHHRLWSSRDLLVADAAVLSSLPWLPPPIGRSPQDRWQWSAWWRFSG